MFLEKKKKKAQQCNVNSGKNKEKLIIAHKDFFQSKCIYVFSYFSKGGKISMERYVVGTHSKSSLLRCF